MRSRLSLSCTVIAAFLALFPVLPGCSESATEENDEEKQVFDCSHVESIEGTPWVPAVPGAGGTNHDLAARASEEVIVKSGSIVGVEQTWAASDEIAFTFNINEDLGAAGSLTLVAETAGYPSDLVGNAYPMLVSLSDGTNEWINLRKSGVSNDCAAAGFFVQNAQGRYIPNPDCTVSSPSAYSDQSHWLYRQIAAYGFVSTNTFPTCDWTSGSPTCHFSNGSTGNFLNGTGRLPTGTYTARYVLMASNYAYVGSEFTSGVKLTVVKKKDPDLSGGAFDVNVILVGTDNIRASRSIKGKQNLDALMSHVYEHYNQGGVGIRLGQVRAYEWPCEYGGDEFSRVDISDGSLESMFKSGSEKVPDANEGKSLNVFLVSDITDTRLNLSILGVSAAIGGPTINATETSGLVFKSGNRLENFNPDCSIGGTCSVSKQESQFVDMGATISHELGHYLGLNHPSERDGSQHDAVPDTPECTTKDAFRKVLTHNSCKGTSLGGSTCEALCPGYDFTGGTGPYCPNVPECQFNHVMWYTTKFFDEATGLGDGNLFSTNSSRILNLNPFVQ